MVAELESMLAPSTTALQKKRAWSSLAVTWDRERTLVVRGSEKVIVFWFSFRLEPVDSSASFLYHLRVTAC